MYCTVNYTRKSYINVKNNLKALEQNLHEYINSIVFDIVYLQYCVQSQKLLILI